MSPKSSADSPSPTREDVTSVWTRIVSGEISRESAHEWAAEWVERSGLKSSDPMVRRALTSIHGFDSASESGSPHLVHHGPPGDYLRSLETIRDELAQWVFNCKAYDSDPQWLERRVRDARKNNPR